MVKRGGRFYKQQDHALDETDNLQDCLRRK